MKRNSSELSRRQFIRQAACAAVGTTAITSTLFDLRLIQHAVAQTPPSDYKALVCLFLYGGNDANNLIVPRSGADYLAYAAARQNLALSDATLLPITQLAGDGREYGLHPACTGLHTLFQSGKLAILNNVGTLVHPVTRAQYQANSVPLPPQLFSHNDQQVQWQTSVSGQPTRAGWGGRCADLLYSLNAGAPVSMCISVNGTNTFEVGNVVQQYQVTTSGAVALSGVSGGQLTAFTNLLKLPSSNLFVQEHQKVVDRALATAALVNSATASVPIVQTWPTTGLGNQLKMIAKLIGAREVLGMKRQIFFASVGGYDTHGEQLLAQSALYAELSDAMKAFHDETVSLGVADRVTTFTASDFGRTFPSNGVGSDHGWGSHQLVMGGAVSGQRLYGRMPVLVVNGPDDTGLGRWIPTTSVDEYSATLARWFGVPDSDLGTVFPNLGHFAQPNLGFLG